MAARPRTELDKFAGRRSGADRAHAHDLPYLPVRTQLTASPDRCLAFTGFDILTGMMLDALKIPGTPVCAAAQEVAAVYCSPALLNHSVRAYLWAAAYGEQRGIAFDPELLFVGSMFHDIALMPEFDNHTVGFDDASGHVAWVFAAGAGWPVARRQRLVEVVLSHMLAEVDVEADPEGHLLERSTSMDISGRHMDDFSVSFKAEVLLRHPRLGIADEFLACFRDQAQRKPDSSPAASLRDNIAERILTNELDHIG